MKDVFKKKKYFDADADGAADEKKTLETIRRELKNSEKLRSVKADIGEFE